MKTAIAALLIAGTLGAAGCATRAVIALGPPPARIEVVPVRPYYGAVWIPGHWVRARYYGNWVWVRGYWR
jgi:hypothetical protein